MITSRFPRANERTYESAIKILNSRRRPQRPGATLSKPSLELDLGTKTPKHDQLKGLPSIVGMQRWLLQLGYGVSDINRLNIVHVAGTKGKGSTCALVESFLRAYGSRTGFPSKTGLYTSPHLIFPEERIRIGFRPISRDLFTKYFFEVWGALSQDTSHHALPRYLQLMALTAFHAFVQEKVEATVVETHHGGEYDATNFIEAPLVTLITALGMDHVQQLGPTIKDIAWHKAGIFKAGARAFSMRQSDEVAEVLRKRASEKGVSLDFSDKDSSLPAEALELKPDVQRANCSLALAGTKAFIEATQKIEHLPLLPQDVSQGIERFNWPGRFQTIVEGSANWYLDAAHNEMSIVKAAEWYTELVRTGHPAKKVLIFGHVSEHRDALHLMKQLVEALSTTSLDYVIFTHYIPGEDFYNVKAQDSPPSEVDLERLNAFMEAWKNVKPSEQVYLKHNVKDAIELAREIGRKNDGMQVLITGSQHLVGGALFYLDHGDKIESTTQV